MDVLELDRLEQNINQAIITIQKLQTENQRLKRQNEESLNKIRDYERTIQEIRKQYHSNSNIENQGVIFQEKEDTIKKKIQQMLEKIETFQQLVFNRE